MSNATYRPDLSDTTATYDEHGSGTIGGPECYAGGEWSQRHMFEHTNGTYTLVTEYAAVIDGRELHNRTDDDTEGYNYTVEDVTEILDCTDHTDPGGTETTRDYYHGEGSVFAYKTIAEAEAEAKRFGARFSHEYFTIPNDDDTEKDNRP